MKREFLENLKVEDKSLPKEIVDTIMKEYGKFVKEKEGQITTLTAERDSFKTSLDDTKSKLEELSKSDENIEKVKEELAILQTKYATDTENLKKEISKNKYDSKVKELVNTLEFSSNASKKAFTTDLIDKGLKLEDNKLLGFDDFVSSYKEQDPDAFKQEQKEKKDKGVTVNTGTNHNSSSNETLDLKSALKEYYDK